jgi:hypothetical protein
MVKKIVPKKNQVESMESTTTGNNNPRTSVVRAFGFNRMWCIGCVPALFLILFTTLAVSQNLWQLGNGVAIRQGIHTEWQRTICPGGDGAIIMVWSDTRTGSRNVYAQKVDPAGNLLWGENGTAVTQLPGRQEDPVAIEDGAGGAYIAWVDYRFDEEGDIFLQHVSADGQILLDPEGAALCRQPGKQLTISMATDSMGGVFVTWEDGRNGVDTDIYGTHIDAAHTIINPGEGVPIIQVEGSQASKSIEYAGDHQALIIWVDERVVGAVDLYAQRITVEMTPVFDVGGLPVAITDQLEAAPRTTFMHGDTALVVWQEGDYLSRVVYQLVTAGGLLLPEPAPVTNSTAPQLSPRLKRDQAGNVFIVWKDLRSDPVDGDYFAQKISTTGSIAWDSAGVLLDPTVEKHGNVRFTVDRNGGAWFFWERGTFPEVDVVVQHLDADGNPLLAADGLTVTAASGYQFAPIASYDSDGGAFVVFGDQESGSIALRIQHLSSGGNLTFPDPGLLIMPGLDGDVKYVFGFQSEPSILLTWEDNRGGSLLFGTWIESTGDIRDFNGRQLTFQEGSSDPIVSEPTVLFTESSIYTATFNAATGAKLIRLNRLNFDLVNEWDSTGVLLNDSLADQRRPFLVPTADGVGCFWSEIRNAIDFDIYYQRFDANGTPLLQPGGVSIAAASWVDDYVSAVFVTPDDQFLVFWKEDVWGAGVLRYQKFDQDGLPAPQWPAGGYTLAGPVGNPGNLVGAVIDDQQGVLVVWETVNNFAADLKLQQVRWDGTIAWPAGGQFLTTAANDQTDPAVAIDPEQHQALIVWEDFRNGLDYNIVGQVVDLATPALLDTNIIFTDDTTFQVNPTVAWVGEGNFILVWEDERGLYGTSPIVSGGVDLYAAGFHTADFSYTRNGIPLVQEYHKQIKPQITPLTGDDYLIHWIDLRSSGKADLANYYGKLITKTDLLATSPEPAVVPWTVTVHPAYPNPFNGTVTIDLDVPAAIPVNVTIYNLLGQTVWDQLLLPAGAGRLRFTWSGIDLFQRPVPAGVYFYTVSSSYGITVGKITYLK